MRLTTLVLALLVVNALGEDTPRRGFLEAFSYKSYEFYAPVSESVTNEMCREHSAWMLRGAANNELWALKMLDASTQGLNGARVGNLMQLGNYDECLSVQQVPYEDTAFSGRHCIVSLGPVTAYSELEQRRKMTETYMYRIQNQLDAVKGDLPALISKMGATIGVCIPSSCTSRDLEQHLRREMRTTNISVRVYELACNSRVDKIVLKTNDWFAIYFLLGLGVIIALSTILDQTCSSLGSVHGVVTSFSLISNWRKLVKVSPASADNMTTLSGVRVISIVWVMMIHSLCVLIISVPSTNYALVESTSYDLAHLVLTNATVAVEPFLVLSGLLVAYNFLKDREKGVPFNALTYYLNRYIRITPPYAAMMLLVATLVNYAGDGPLWKVNMAASREGCEKNWMFGLLFVNNYIPGEEMCMGRMGESWYLALDMQMFLLSPLILFPLFRWRKMGKVLLGVVLVIGLAISCAVPYINRLPFIITPAHVPSAYSNYFASHTRFTPWVIGIGLGYALHATKYKPLKLSTASVIGGWILGLVILNVSFLTSYFFMQEDYVYDRLTAALYVGLFRPGFSLGVAWIIFACVRGYGGKVNAFLSCGPMQILGRLSYAVYLSHLTFFRYVLSSIQTPQYNTESVLAMNFTSYVIFSFAVALVLHLVFEAPILSINNIFRKKGGHKEDKLKL